MESFLKIAEMQGIDLSFIYDGTVSIHFGNLNEGNDPEDGRTIAIAWGSENDSAVHVEVDPVVWAEMNEIERTATMYHELSHDILNASHVNEIDGHLMHTHNQFETITQLVEAVILIFEEYKDGNLRVFGPDTKY